MAWRNTEDIPGVAKVLLPLLEGYLNSDSEQHKKYYLETLKWPCRYLERFIAPEISMNALLEAQEMGIGDPRKYNWSHQKKEMKDPERKIFHWEHVYPVSSMVKDLLKLEDLSIEAVSDIAAKADIAWILKSEDKLLSKHGFRSKRPANPWDAYIQAGIEKAN